MNLKRREFIKNVGIGGAGIVVAPSLLNACYSNEKLFFKISLAQWSLHKSFFGGSLNWQEFGKNLMTNPNANLKGDIDPIDFSIIAKRDFGIDAVEYVNTFYFDKANDMEYLKELKTRSDNEGVSNQLIMCDALGNLGDPDEANRKKTVENHYPWVEAAKYLGCHSIRVNAASDRSLSSDEQMKLAADGLRMLSEFGAEHKMNIIVENHGGMSSNAQWLAGVMETVGMKNCGTLPDFGNFRIGPDEEYDRYKGMEELMPYAKGVSAKAHEFDSEGNEVNSDFYRILKIVKDAGFKGYIGIEYEGSTLSEPEGIKATKLLLEKAGAQV